MLLKLIVGGSLRTRSIRNALPLRAYERTCMSDNVVSDVPETPPIRYSTTRVDRVVGSRYLLSRGRSCTIKRAFEEAKRRGKSVSEQRPLRVRLPNPLSNRRRLELWRRRTRTSSLAKGQKMNTRFAPALEQSEYSALLQLCAQELRNPSDQAKYMLLDEPDRRGLEKCRTLGIWIRR